MNDLNKYILEKLHINKDTKISDDSEDIHKSIIDFCSINDDKLKNIIYKWVINYNVKLISIYVYKNESNNYLDTVDKSIYYNKRYIEKTISLSFNSFLEKYYKLFGDVESKRKKYIVYDEKEMIVLENENGLSMTSKDYDIIITKNKTIYD